MTLCGTVLRADGTLPFVNRHAVDWRWRLAYRRMVNSAFRTVPLYREQWALRGRTDPVLVRDRTGVHSGAVRMNDVLRRMVDLVPLAGGSDRTDPTRGLGPVLSVGRSLHRNDFVAVLDAKDTPRPWDLPRGVRGRVLDPESEQTESAWLDLTNALRRNGTVVAVGADKQLAELVAVLPAELTVRLDVVARRELSELDSGQNGQNGLLHDRTLGYLGGLRDCGRWHLDWQRVYARETDAGLAFTLLRQHSPRLVDILVPGAASVGRCPRHGTPVVTP
jgi:hypothetical protein